MIVHNRNGISKRDNLRKTSVDPDMYQAAVAVFRVRAARSTDNDQVIVGFDGLNTAFRHRCNLTAVAINKAGTRTLARLAQVIAVCGIEHAARRCVFIAASVNDAIAVEFCPFRTVGQNDLGNPFSVPSGKTISEIRSPRPSM